ncbi:phage major capsid protein [Micromonospora purpureochromogenes]|uniref:phage major capsid protein n=1 Tax=Micromonospora purpureochromogenes TaxID=47872 RepID=UPI003640B35F
MTRTIQDVMAEHKAAKERGARLVAEMETIADIERDLTPGERERLDRIQRGADRAIAEANELDAEWRQMIVNGGPGIIAVRGVPGDYPERSARSGERGQALDLIERSAATAGHVFTHDAAEYVTRQVERDESPTGEVARWIHVAGDPAYRSAFRKLVADPLNGHRLFTDAELRAFQAAQTFSRAMSLTDAAGGYMVPMVLDPAVILTGSGTSNANLRRVFTNRVIAGEAWNGVSGSTTAEWVAEAAQVADKSPTLVQPTIPVHKWDVFVPFSVEVGDDAANFETEIVRVMTDARDNLEATAFIAGSGVGQPTGLVTATLAVGGNIVPTATADAIVAADVFSLKSALPGRYRGNAAFLANDDIYDRLRQITAGINPDAWITGDPSGQQRLTGKLMYESSEMDGVITATAGNDPCLIYGDLSRYYVIDRAGSSRVELVPHLFSPTNQRPTLSRGFILWGRTGGNLVDTAAVRILRA